MLADPLLNRLLVLGMPLVDQFEITRTRIRDPIMQRYVAGQNLEECLKISERFHNQGFGLIIDVLGEKVSKKEEAELYKEEYIKVIEAVGELRNLGFDIDISLKLSQIGLGPNGENYNICQNNLDHLVVYAAFHKAPLWIDMEDFPFIDSTLELWKHYYNHGRDIGIVLQAYLHRTEDDIKCIIRKDKPLKVRLVKGVYNPPKNITYKNSKEIFDNFHELLKYMIEKGFYVAIATQNREALTNSLSLIQSKDLPRSQFEFQFMYGVGEHNAEYIRNRDSYCKIKFYSPYGNYGQAYRYILRRCQKNPAIAREALHTFFRNQKFH